MKQKLLTLLMGVVLFFFAVSAGIGAPILSRPFYYHHVKALSLSESTSWSEETIKEAYDDVMDFMFKPGAAFKTGTLKWSESGRSHFEDVRVLFRLDVAVLGVTILAIAVLEALRRKGKTPSWHAAALGAGVCLLAFFAAVGVGGATDFDRAFEVFHVLFFPGKTNWIFDGRTDEIIWVLPEEYFRNCAILAIAIIAALAVFYIIYGAVGRRRKAAP